jgi:hypothetical protein
MDEPRHLDRTIARLLERDVPPLRPDFSTELRAELADRWDDRWDPSSVPSTVVRFDGRHRRRLVVVLVTAVTLVAAAVAVVVLTGRDTGRRIKVVPGVATSNGLVPATEDFALPTPTGRWVVTDGPATMPPVFQAWLEFDGPSSITGFDGCNTFTNRPTGYTVTQGDCEFTGLDMSGDIIDRLLTVTPKTMQVGRFTAQLLPNGPADSNAVIGRWQVAGLDAVVTFSPDQRIHVAGCDLDVGHWELDPATPAMRVTANGPMLECVPPPLAAALSDPGLSLAVDAEVAWLSTSTTSMLRLDRFVLTDAPLGSNATPAEGGVELGRWTADQIAALGAESVGEGTAVGLSDGTLAVLTSDHLAILLVAADGTVAKRIDLPSLAGYIFAAGGDIIGVSPAETGNAAAARTRFLSMVGAGRGQEVPDPAMGLSLSGGSCADGVDRGAVHWSLETSTACHEGTEPVMTGMADGSVLLHRLGYLPSEDDPAETTVERSAVRLDPDGSRRQVVLGRHAFDGSEGWASSQATATGGVTLFRFSTGNIVLHRFTYGDSIPALAA